MKKEISITIIGESTTERVFEDLKTWCGENFQEFQLEVKGKDREGEEKIFEHEQEKNGRRN